MCDSLLTISTIEFMLTRSNSAKFLLT